MRAATGGGMVNKIQLLVHVGAAANRRDDDNYRELAKAYVHFHESRNEIGLTVTSADGELVGHERGCRGQSRADLPSLPPPETITIVDGTQLAQSALESLLLTSSLIVPLKTPSERFPPCDGDFSQWPEDLDMQSPQKFDEHKNNSKKIGPTNSHSRIHSPGLRRHGNKRRLIGNDFADSAIQPFKPPLRQIAISEKSENRPGRWSTPAQRNKSAQSERTSSVDLKTPNLNRAVAQLEPFPEEIPTRFGNHISVAYLPKCNESSFLAAQNRERTHESRQVDSYAPLAKFNRIDKALDSDFTTVGPKEYLRISNLLCSDAEPTKGLRTQHEQAVSAHSESHHLFPEGGGGVQRQLDKYPSNVTASDKEQPFEMHPMIGDETVRNKCREQLESDLDTSVETSLSDLPITIIAPEPAASTGKFTTHITERLLFLSDESELSGHFNPVFIKRQIQPLERGHWSFNPSIWTLCLQTKFWQFLERFICQGHAGWGVFCAREPFRDQGLGSVQVFCWGEIVKHIYLLLYVASNSQIRNLGLKWIDAEGHLIVEMRSY